MTRTLFLLAALGALPGVSLANPVAFQSAKAVPKEVDGQKLSSHQRMVQALKDILSRTDDENFLLGGYKVRNMKQVLANLSPEAKPFDRFRLMVELADATIYYGEEAEGLAMYDKLWALGLEKQPDSGIPAETVQDARIRNAAGYLRKAETENCCAMNNKDSCILPFRGDAVHKKPEGATKAVEILKVVVAETEKNSPQHLRAQWMLNMGCMALGKWPDMVPEGERLPAKYFEGAKFKHFTNVANDVGLDYVNLAGGAIADDFDNDGDLDLFISGYGSDGQLQYFTNEDGFFKRRTEEAGLMGIYGGLNILQADYDNDGLLDVYVPRGAWLSEIGLQPDSLLHNNGDGTFTDRSFDAGLSDVFYPNVTACFADYDNDGDLDIYVGNEQDDKVKAPCQLFRNNGDGTFTDVGEKAGVTNNRYTRAVNAGDYDGDGFPDFYVSNLGADNRLYHNNGDGTFTDVAPKLGVTAPKRSYPCWFYDYNNDGNLDIQVLAFGARPQDIAAYALGVPYDADLPSLYLNDGKGGFKDIAREAGLLEPFSVMGAQVGDFDNDGWLDFYGGTGRPEARDLVPDKAYHNKGGKGFEDITLDSGLGHLQKGHGRSFADFDGDGDLDVVAQMGGAFRSDLFHNALYENPGFDNNWLEVKLEGKKSNRCAIGARVRADFVDGETTRSVYRWVNSGSSFGSNPLRIHIGLGKAKRIDTLEVYWPTTKTTQTFKDLAINRFLEIEEGADTPKIVPVKHYKLGGMH